MKAINKLSGKEVEITGYKIVNGKTYLIFKGASKDSYLSFEYVTKLDGSSLTEDDFDIKAKEAKTSQIEFENMFLSVNDRMNQNSTYNTACRILGKLNTNGNDFLESLKTSFLKYNRLSEKQAYYLAKEAAKQGL